MIRSMLFNLTLSVLFKWRIILDNIFSLSVIGGGTLLVVAAVLSIGASIGAAWYAADRLDTRTAAAGDIVGRVRAWMLQRRAADLVPVGSYSRSDDLYELEAGLTWAFAPGWSLRPSVLWVRDESNTLWGNYSSTEVMVMVRRSF